MQKILSGRDRMIKKAIALKRAAISAEDVDLDLGELAQPYPLIPEGEYDVAFVKAHEMNIFRRIFPRVLGEFLALTA